MSFTARPWRFSFPPHVLPGKKERTVHYTTFGKRTGLRVSQDALGTANFGTGWAKRGPSWVQAHVRGVR